MLFSALCHLFWGIIGGATMALSPLLYLITGISRSPGWVLTEAYAGAAACSASPVGRVIDLWLDLCLLCWCIYYVARVLVQRGWAGAWQHWALSYLRNGRELEHHATRAIRAIRAVMEWQARMCFKMADLALGKKEKIATIATARRARSSSSPAIRLPLPSPAIAPARIPYEALTHAEFETMILNIVPVLSDEEFRARYPLYNPFALASLKKHHISMPLPWTRPLAELCINGCIETLAREKKDKATALSITENSDGQSGEIVLHY